MSFVRACAVDDVAPGSVLAIDLGGDADIAVVNTVEGWFAIQDRCSHAEVPLSDGEVDGCTLECLAHGSRFDLRTGVPLEPPAIAPVPTYPIRAEGAHLYIDPDNPVQTRPIESQEQS